MNGFACNWVQMKDHLIINNLSGHSWFCNQQFLSNSNLHFPYPQNMIIKLTGGRHVQRLKYTRKLLIWKGYQAFSLPIGIRLSEKYSEPLSIFMVPNHGNLESIPSTNFCNVVILPPKQQITNTLTSKFSSRRMNCHVFWVFRLFQNVIKNNTITSHFHFITIPKIKLTSHHFLQIGKTTKYSPLEFFRNISLQV